MKQLELKLQIKGTSQAEKIKKGVPSLKQLIDDRKMKPKGLENISDKMIAELKWLHRGRI
ncbi:MAG TPA: hypothetical protein DCM10_04600 [Xanthomarina gelatinilytica]|nr:hypothetical protein [Xanthomarina gelatinilytica]